jgi:hypothetical protein
MIYPTIHQTLYQLQTLIYYINYEKEEMQETNWNFIQRWRMKMNVLNNVIDLGLIRIIIFPFQVSGLLSLFQCWELFCRYIWKRWQSDLEGWLGVRTPSTPDGLLENSMAPLSTFWAAATSLGVWGNSKGKSMSNSASTGGNKWHEGLNKG